MFPSDLVGVQAVHEFLEQLQLTALKQSTQRAVQHRLAHVSGHWVSVRPVDLPPLHKIVPSVALPASAAPVGSTAPALGSVAATLDAGSTCSWGTPA